MRRRSAWSASRLSIADRSAGGSCGGTRRPGLAVGDELAEAAHRARDDRPRAGHRLGADEPEALAPGRADDHGGARVALLELRARRGSRAPPGRPRAAGRRPRRRGCGPRSPRRAPRRPSPARACRRRGARAARPRRRSSRREARRRCGSRARSSRRGRARCRRPHRTPPRRRGHGRSSSRRSGGKRFRSATSEPCSVVTSGRPEARAGATEGSQCACTRSAPRAARRTVRAIEARSGGTAHGLRTAFFVSPAP